MLDTTLLCSSESTGADLPRRSAQPRGGEQELHLRVYLRVLGECRWILVGTWALILGVVTAHTLSQVPLYRATARVLIEPTQANIANVENVYDPTGGSSLREYYRTQHELLKSRRVNELVFLTAGLDRLPDSDGVCVLVVRMFSTDREQVRNAAGQLTVAGVKLVGVVMNNVDAPSRPGADAYGGSYSHDSDLTPT